MKNKKLKNLLLCCSLVSVLGVSGCSIQDLINQFQQNQNTGGGNTDTPVNRDGLTINTAWTAEQAVNMMKSAGEGKVVDNKEYFVTGVFDEGTSVNAEYHEFYGTATCESETLTIGGAKLSGVSVSEVDGALDGYTFVIHGYLEMYEGKYKIGYLPANVSPTGNKYTPTIVKLEKTSGTGGNTTGGGITGGGTTGGGTTSGDYSIVGNLQTDFGGYYASISKDAKGTELLNQLHSLNATKRKRTVGYDGMRTIAKQTDTASGTNGRIVSFYSRTLVGPAWDSGATWNREHVWPNSLGGNKVEADGHMVRPCSTSDNGNRGNKVFAESGAYDPGCLGCLNYRGIAARIVFYCAIADTSLQIKNVKSGSSNTMGYLNDLLKWNIDYPPSTSATADLELRVEQNRNNVLAQSNIQGNRNPFIDHPEFAMRIWGNI